MALRRTDNYGKTIILLKLATQEAVKLDKSDLQIDQKLLDEDRKGTKPVEGGGKNK